MYLSDSRLRNGCSLAGKFRGVLGGDGVGCGRGRFFFAGGWNMRFR